MSNERSRAPIGVILSALASFNSRRTIGLELDGTHVGLFRRRDRGVTAQTFEFGLYREDHCGAEARRFRSVVGLDGRTDSMDDRAR